MDIHNDSQLSQAPTRKAAYTGSLRGERASLIYSLIETAVLNGLNPQAYLADVVARVAGHPAKRIDELLPWNWQSA